METVINDIITNQDKKIEKGVIFNFLEEAKIFLKDKIDISDLRSKLKHDGTGNTFQIGELYANSKPDEVMTEIKKCLKKSTYDFNLKTDLSILQRIHLKFIFHYYSEIVRGFSNQEHIAGLIKRLDKRIDDLAKVIEIKDNDLDNFFTIVSLKAVNSEMTKILPL